MESSDPPQPTSGTLLDGTATNDSVAQVDEAVKVSDEISKKKASASTEIAVREDNAIEEKALEGEVLAGEVLIADAASEVSLTEGRRACDKRTIAPRRMSGAIVLNQNLAYKRALESVFSTPIAKLITSGLSKCPILGWQICRFLQTIPIFEKWVSFFCYI